LVKTVLRPLVKTPTKQAKKALKNIWSRSVKLSEWI